jgi:hypothetical protein
MHDRFLVLYSSLIAPHYDNAQKNRKLGHLENQAFCVGAWICRDLRGFAQFNREYP